jgi:hypothetical protein
MVTWPFCSEGLPPGHLELKIAGARHGLIGLKVGSRTAISTRWSCLIRRTRPHSFHPRRLRHREAAPKKSSSIGGQIGAIKSAESTQRNGKSVHHREGTGIELRRAGIRDASTVRHAILCQSSRPGIDLADGCHPIVLAVRACLARNLVVMAFQPYLAKIHLLP